MAGRSFRSYPLIPILNSHPSPIALLTVTRPAGHTMQAFDMEDHFLFHDLCGTTAKRAWLDYV